MDILEKIREMLEAGKISKEDIERAFPKLKESDDERVRLEIHAYLFNTLHNTQQLTPRTNELERWLAYLEKQKEQQPHWKPSEEYMQALEIVLDYHAFASTKNRAAIKSLYEELKKL